MFKDARSVSLYPYTWSHILQYNNDLNIVTFFRIMTLFCDNINVWYTADTKCINIAK